jgi:voltage-gated potassium channel
MNAFIKSVIFGLYQYKMLLLLVSLVVQIVIPAFFVNKLHYQLVNHVTVIITLLTGFLIFEKSRKHKGFKFVMVLVVIAVLSSIIDLVIDQIAVFSYARFVVILLMYVLFFIHIFKDLGSRVLVNQDFIFGSIAGYLILGFIASLICYFLMQFYPDAIVFKTSNLVYHDYLYFAFITLTTVGYGDITAALPVGEAFSVVVALSGQLYLTITIGIIVGRYLSERAIKSGK